MRIKMPPFKVVSLIIVNSAIYASSALYFCFIQIYLSAGLGLRAVTVGNLLSVGQVVAVFAPVLWGVWTDKAKYKNSVLLAACAGAGICYLGVMLSANIWWLALTLAATMFFLSAFGGLCDTITIEYTYSAGYRYGGIRVMGTVFYGLVACGLSFYLEKNINLIFWGFAALCALACVFLLTSPKVEGHAHGEAGAKKKEKTDWRAILGDRNLLWIFVMAAVAQFAWSYYLNFYPTHIKQTLGLPDWVWGLNIAFTVLGEIPFFLMFNRIFDKFRIKTVLLAAVLLTTVRYALLAVATGSFTVLLYGALTGISISVYTYCGTMYISRNLAPKIQATAQTVMYSLAMGVPRIIAGFGGGIMTEKLGTANSLFICSALALLTLVAFPFVFKGKEIGRSVIDKKGTV